MQVKNTSSKYGIVTIFFHWLIAVIVIGQLILGTYMVDLPKDSYKAQVYGWHKEIGVVILLLILLRVIWRLMNISPTSSSISPRWQIVAANLVHWGFYFLLIALPLSGWLMSSAFDKPVSFFGLFVLPNLISPNEQLGMLFDAIHYWLAVSLIAAITLHVLAVIQHYLFYGENILRKMLP